MDRYNLQGVLDETSFTELSFLSLGKFNAKARIDQERLHLFIRKSSWIHSNRWTGGAFSQSH
jgi:hypothetical protein